MKATVLQDAFLGALDYVTKGIDNNAALPIFSGVLLKATDGVLELQTSNMDASIKYQISCEIEEPGGCVVPATMLFTMVKNCPNGSVFLESSAHDLNLKSQTLEYSLPALPKEDFPEFPVFNPETSLELPAHVLYEMVSKVYNVASVDTSHPILTGVLLRLEDNTLRLVATDSFRLAVAETHIDAEKTSDPFEIVLYSKNLHAALSLGTKEDNVLVSAGKAQVSFTFGKATYVSKRLEGNFPNYKQLLPEKCTTKLLLHKEAFIEALKRVSIVANSSPIVKFNVDMEGKFIKLITKNSGNESAQEQFDISGEGESLLIGLNHRYILDCLHAANDVEELSLELAGEAQPAVFKAPAAISYLYLLMPMRL